MIGFGNSLRGDDAIGPWLVEWALPRWIRWWRQSGQLGGRRPLLEEVALRSVPQLLPELAVELGAVRRVLFVDAWLAPPAALPWLGPLEQPGASSVSHGLQPSDLLALAALLTQPPPRAERLLVPAGCWDPPLPGQPARFSAPLRRQLPLVRCLCLAWLWAGQAEATRGGPP